MPFVYLVKHIGAEEGCALACGQVCTFMEMLVQTVWVGVVVEHHVGTVHLQVVEIQGRGVICWVEGVDLIAPLCLVNKMVKRVWQQHLFKC